MKTFTFLLIVVVGLVLLTFPVNAQIKINPNQLIPNPNVAVPNPKMPVNPQFLCKVYNLPNYKLSVPELPEVVLNIPCAWNWSVARVDINKDGKQDITIKLVTPNNATYTYQFYSKPLPCNTFIEFYTKCFVKVQFPSTQPIAKNAIFTMGPNAYVNQEFGVSSNVISYIQTTDIATTGINSVIVTYPISRSVHKDGSNRFVYLYGTYGNNLGQDVPLMNGSYNTSVFTKPIQYY
ncbi:MAG: hypothetical protein ACRCXZ_02435 [Patescibacteria group bacterium]